MKDKRTILKDGRRKMKDGLLHMFSIIRISLFIFHYSSFISQSQRGFIKLTKRTLFLLSSVVLAFAVIVIINQLVSPNSASAAWFNDSWGFRKAITVTVTSSASDILNLDTLITVDTTGITSQLQTNCEDLRFTSVTGDILPYFIDSCSDNSATNKIWVRVNLVPKNTTTYTMYMYYGNPSAAAGSDANRLSLYKDLEAYWTLNESVVTSSDRTDSSVNANTLTDTNGIPSATGQFSNAADFERDNAEQLSIADNTYLSMGDIDFTITGWVKLESKAANRIIGCKGDSNTTLEYCLYTEGGAGVEYIRFLVSGNGTDTGGQYATADSAAVAIDTWYFVVASHNSVTNQISIQLNNGTPVTTSWSSGVFNSSSSFRLGKSNYFGVEYMDGLIDDFRVYKRVLSADEKTQLYTNPGTITTTAIATSAPSTSFATAEKAPSPVAYWKLDDGTGTNANDSTTNNLDGTLTNTPTWQSEDLCVSGKCLYFDGTTKYVDVTSSSLLNPGTGNLSVGFWMRRTSTDGRGGVVKAQGDTTSEGAETYQGYALLVNSTGAIFANIGTNASNLRKIHGTAGTATGITNNEWTYLAMTWDSASQTLKLYKNGVLVGTDSTGSGTVGDITYSGNLKIGCLSTTYCNAGNTLNGFIDEPKIYNQALTAAQIQANYNARSNPEGVATTLGAQQDNNPGALNNGLVGYWKMNESSGNAADSSGLGNTLTNTNTATYTAGKYGNGGTFASASSQYLTCTDANCGGTSELDVSGTAISTSTWFKTSTTSGWQYFNNKKYGYTLLFSRDTGGGGLGTSGVLNFLVGSSDSWLCGASTSQSTTTLADGAWHNVVGVRNGADIYIYIDGALSGSASTCGTSAQTNSTYDYYVGAGHGQGGSVSGYLNGSLDETKVYNRALSPAEVSQLYNFAPGPVGYWKMDENRGTSAFDSSGNANTGTLTLGPTWTPGKYGDSVSFDGSNDYITVTDSTSLDITGDLTISAWFKPSDGQPSAAKSLVTKWNTSNLSYNLGLTTAGKIIMYITSDGTTTSNYQMTDSAVFSNGQATAWKHIEAVYSTAGTITIYVDGVVVPSTETGTLPSSIYSGTAALEIATDAGGQDPYGGLVDDVKIYSYARTATQVVSDMNAGHPSVGSPISSPIGYWKFEEGAANTCSGSTNDACNSGSQGSALDGAFNGTISYTQSGKFGKAISPDGSSGYVSVADNNSLDFGTNPFSVSTWVEFPLAGSTVWNGIVTKGFTTSAPANTWGLNSGNPATNLVYQDATDAGGAWNVTVTFDGTTLSSGFHHVVVTRSGTAYVMYVDGVSRATGTGLATVNLTNTSAVEFGRSQGYFSKDIDDVKIYNYALTADQVKLDMNRQSAQVLGALSDNSTYQKQAANQEYCIPGDSTTCTAPTAEYKFEEGAGSSVYDSSGNNLVGTKAGTTTWDIGKTGKGLKFVDDNDTVSMGDVTTFDGYTAMTLELWMKVDSSSTYPDTRLVSKDDEVNQRAFVLTFQDNPSYELFFSVWGATSGNVARYSSTGSLDDNKWHHVAAVWEGGTTMNIYLDGKLNNGSYSSQTISGALKNTTSNFRFGDDDWAGGNGILGNIDNVRIFNYARTASQIAWDYNRGAPVSHWKLDDCQGAVAKDSGINANNNPTGYNGTLTATSTIGTCATSSTFWGGSGGTGAGKVNYAPTFNGTGDYFSITSATNLGLTTDITISGWVKTSSLTNSQCIVCQASTGYVLQVYSSGTGVGSDGRARASKITFSKNGTDEVTSTAALSVDTWYHIAVTQTGGLRKIYINGSLDYGPSTCSNSSTCADFAGLTTLNIGSTPTPNTYFTGQIDDVKIFNYALNATQIKTLYSGGATNFRPASGTP